MSGPTEAREAMAAGDWATAYELFAEADASDPLPPQDLMVFAQAAYGAGELELTLDTFERAHAQFVQAGAVIEAAAAATQLAMHLIIDTGLLAPVRAWVKRAERLLADQGETPLHAWLGTAHACERWLSGDFAASREWAQRAIDLGDRHGEPGAATFARVAFARCVIFEGQIDEGLRLLDDAAERLLSEEIDPLTAGCLYCEMVCIWQGLARYDKAEEWTEAMERFGHDHAVGSISGRCRVHRAEILRLRGALSEAEEEALGACDQLRPYLRYEFGWPLTELGRIQLTRGDLAGAERSFLTAHEIGWDPQPGLALLLLAQGDTDAAVASIKDALDNPLNVPSKERPPNNDLRRAPILEAFVEITVAAGDIEAARKACDELSQVASTFGSAGIVAGSALASGRVRLAEGDASGARYHLQNAVRLWSEISAPFEAAVARTVLAEAHRAEGNEQSAALELRAARSTFARVGAPDRSTLATQIPERQVTATEQNVFRREGDYWSIVFEGTTVRLRDMKGLHHLSQLMSDPGREFHAVDLVALDRGAAVEVHAGNEPGLEPAFDNDAGELLDARAKEVYRRRLQEIDEDIEEARSFGDAERAARGEAEREFLLRELSRAVGFSGRDRRAGATSERARASVTRAIRHAMTRIETGHSALGEHLERTVRTGTYCVYMPDPRVPVDWSF
jgi:tetratricopeptide (TPR) repeat protein